MSINSSSSIDSYNFQIYNLQCLYTHPNHFYILTFTITNFLILFPICIFILYHGFHEWWLRNSSPAHSDYFTYHLVAMELILILGYFCMCFGIYLPEPILVITSVVLFVFNWQGEALLQILMCVEQYLAVVHPVVYLGLKNERGVRMRAVSVGCVWLACFVAIPLMSEAEKFFEILEMLLCFVFLACACFCSVSVLRVLIRPHPGDRGTGRKRPDQSKLKNFYIIVAILFVLGLRFSLAFALATVFFLKMSQTCAIVIAGFWIYLPSSLVLPLLFLYRAGKLPRCVFGKPSN